MPTENDPRRRRGLHQQARLSVISSPPAVRRALHEVVEPHRGLPGGALIVDFIETRTAPCRTKLDAMAESLAAIHSLPLAAGDVNPSRTRPSFPRYAAGCESNARRFLDKAVPDAQARVEIAEELGAMRALAPTLGTLAQPLSVALADTHPGNFIVDDKAQPGSSISRRCMSARPRSISRHATLPTSTLWHRCRQTADARRGAKLPTTIIWRC